MHNRRTGTLNPQPWSLVGVHRYPRRPELQHASGPNLVAAQLSCRCIWCPIRGLVRCLRLPLRITLQKQRLHALKAKPNRIMEKAMVALQRQLLKSLGRYPGASRLRPPFIGLLHPCKNLESLYLC